MKYKKEYEWLKEVDSLSLANAQINLQPITTFFAILKSVFQNSNLIKIVIKALQQILSMAILS